jgi:dipeptidase
MKKILFQSLFSAVLLVLSYTTMNACTNFLITKGASADGSCMITYAADSHVLYGELYFWPAADYAEGSMLDVYEWDTGKFLGKIKQVAHTYSVVGNINEHQLAIGETTYGGRNELVNPEGIIDYGSLIYITLQRAKTAREAIKVMTELVAEYGYYSSGESFSIADANEAWILDLIGKGPGNKGAVWVARMIPDGYVSGHANQARITTFPQSKKEGAISSKKMDKIFDKSITTVYAEDVISFAREKGYYKGKKDEDFSFVAAYAPLNFGALRFCEARVWAGFNKITKGMEKYEDYAMGHTLDNPMPLWVKPDKKLTVQDVMGLMRDHFEGTALDMTKDIGAGPFAKPYRWRPLTWEVDSVVYCNERAIATQQTGFSFVTQSRSNLPDPIGGIIWFGVDDASSTVYTPMYCGMTEIPENFKVGNGDMMDFTFNSAFWIFNMVSNFAYTRYSDIHPDIEKVQQELENKYVASVKELDAKAAELYKTDKKAAVKLVTDFSLKQGKNTYDTWKNLYGQLFAKFMDGNIKTKRPVPENHKYVTPDVKQPGYSKEWYRKVIEETKDHFEVKKIGEETGH